MKIFRRVILLGLFIAAGIGIALGLGFSTEASIKAPIEAPIEASNEVSNEVSNDVAVSEVCVNSPMQKAVAALSNPPFAGQATPSATPQTPVAGGASQPDATQPKTVTLAQKEPCTKSSEKQVSPLNIGDLTSTVDAGSVLQQAADLLDNAANKNNKPSGQVKQLAAPTPEHIPAGTVTQQQPASRGQIGDLKVIGHSGNERLSINIQNADIREVLDLISQQGNLNILTSSQVQGSVSATLSDVDLNSALDAILKSAGLTARREGSFIFVGNNADFESMERSMDRVSTRVYRPNYVQASELQELLKPVLTQGVPGVGVVSVTTASEKGIESDGNQAGGDTYAGSDAVVVRDFEAILAEIDQLVVEVDVRPTQVQIEAMILSVTLSDDFEFGVSFEILRQFPHLRFGWGTPQSSLNSVSSEGKEIPFKYDGALDVAFLDQSLGAFVKAVEKVGDTDVIGTPRVLVLNKHRAEIQVGESLGYVNTTQTETANTQNVNMLELGTILRIRPFISSDGIIRMEVHPEISDGFVEVKDGFTLPNKQTSQVTTNVMVHDGCTVVIGGLIKEEVEINRTQVPLLGSLPVVGVAFRNKKEVVKRRELIVLLTPHIVKEPAMCSEGSQAACEFHRRQEVALEKTSPLSTRSLARRYTRKAQQAWAMGDRDRAMRLVEMAVNFDPQSRKAIDLRSNIWMGRRIGKHTLPPEPNDNFEQNPLDGRQVAPWIIDDLGEQPAQPDMSGQPIAPIPMQAVPMNAVPQHPIDPGQPGRRMNLHRPEKLESLGNSNR